MLIIAYTLKSRQTYKLGPRSGRTWDQDDELDYEIRQLWGGPVQRGAEYWYQPGFTRGTTVDCTWYWRAESPEAELWLSLNAPPGYEIWESTLC